MKDTKYTPSFFRFEDLRVYQKAITYFVKNQKMSATCRDENNGRLLDTFLEKSLGISQKIAEGSSKSKTDFIVNLKESKSLVRQCVGFITIFAELGYCPEEQQNESYRYLEELTKMIGALISSLSDM